jgi:hypothetical protein
MLEHSSHKDITMYSKTIKMQVGIWFFHSLFSKRFQLIVKVFLNTKNNHEELITTEQVCHLWEIPKTNDKIM